MLPPDHPLLPILQRLRALAPSDLVHCPEQPVLRQLLSRLQSGLFERLPQDVIEAVCAHGGHLHHALDPIFLEIVRSVGEGQPVPDNLIDTFRHRVARHHPREPAEMASTVIDFHSRT